MVVLETTCLPSFAIVEGQSMLHGCFAGRYYAVRPLAEQAEGWFSFALTRLAEVGQVLTGIGIVRAINWPGVRLMHRRGGPDGPASGVRILS